MNQSIVACEIIHKNFSIIKIAYEKNTTMIEPNNLMDGQKFQH